MAVTRGVKAWSSHEAPRWGGLHPCTGLRSRADPRERWGSSCSPAPALRFSAKINRHATMEHFRPVASYQEGGTPSAAPDSGSRRRALAKGWCGGAPRSPPTISSSGPGTLDVRSNVFYSAVAWQGPQS